MVVQAARGLCDNPAVVMLDTGGRVCVCVCVCEVGGGLQCWEIGFARTPRDLKILFGPLA